jgi:hypothetical protein
MPLPLPPGYSLVSSLQHCRHLKNIHTHPWIVEVSGNSLPSRLKLLVTGLPELIKFWETFLFVFLHEHLIVCASCLDPSHSPSHKISNDIWVRVYLWLVLPFPFLYLDQGMSGKKKERMRGHSILILFIYFCLISVPCTGRWLRGMSVR